MDIVDVVMANFLVDDYKLFLGHLADIFIAVEGYADAVIITKMQSTC